MLDWDDFRVFLALQRERTLSAAARELKIDQSTVGRRLTALEAAAGARLFDRTPAGYALTAAGEAVAGSVADLERSALSIERQLLGQDAQVAGKVRLATSDSFAVWFLVPRLAGLRERHPGIQVELVTGNPPVDLGRREADVSLRLTKPEQPNLVARCLGDVAWALYASEAYLSRYGSPDPRQQLAGHDVIVLDEELRGTAGARWLAANGERGRVVLSANSLLSQAAAVVAGLGLSPLPCVFGDTQPGLSRLPPGIIGQHQIWLVVHAEVRASARVRALVEYLAGVLQSESALLSGQLARRVPARRPRRTRA
jgi:DNA-binding transcriptional LysR family regulator